MAVNINPLSGRMPFRGLCGKECPETVVDDLLLGQQPPESLLDYTHYAKERALIIARAAVRRALCDNSGMEPSEWRPGESCVESALGLIESNGLNPNDNSLTSDQQRVLCPLTEVCEKNTS